MKDIERALAERRQAVMAPKKGVAPAAGNEGGEGVARAVRALAERGPELGR